MATRTESRRAWTEAIARSAAYAFLGRALAYPEQGQLEILRERIIPALRALPLEGQAGAALREASPGFEGLPRGLQAAHVALFALTVSPDCPDYETAYLSRDVFQQTQVMADVAGFYRAHGLEPRSDQPQRPDQIGTELEFMGFLARKEAYALERLEAEKAEMAREAQSLFLRDHLGCWGPPLGRRIASFAAEDSAYQRLGRALEAWLTADCARLGVTPIPTADGPVLAWPEPDDGSCGLEGECPLVAPIPEEA